MSYTARFSGFGVTFSACLFSKLFAQSVLWLLWPLRTRPETLPGMPMRGVVAVLALFSVRAHSTRVTANNARNHLILGITSRTLPA